MVEEDPAAFWDARFAGEDYWYGTAPNAWLARETGRLRPGGAVLVPADGEGRNGVWLARNGFRVTAVDISARGLEKARRLAERHGVSLEFERADLRSWRWPEACFDAVVAIFAHFAPEVRTILHRRMLQALVPGGLILLEAYTPEQLRHGTGGPRDPALLYRATDLRADFVDAELLLLEEVETDLAEGIGHRGRSAVVRLIACRPAAICGQGGRPLATTCSTETVQEDR